MPKKKEWFDEWFNSPYYHILYQHRDEHEARFFIDNLMEHFHFATDDHILDLACGRGRHALYLHQKGLEVTGLDLSPHNIKLLKPLESDRLHFLEHDMRKPYGHLEYDYILNLFTSFGYFESREEHQTAMNMVSLALKPKGRFILDFLNPYLVKHKLGEKEEKVIDDIHFTIKKQLAGQSLIIKSIDIIDDQKRLRFEEKVRAIDEDEFREYFSRAGLKIEKMFGDYRLQDYDRSVSSRMIFVLKKESDS